jgi:hypothetical protein
MATAGERGEDEETHDGFWAAGVRVFSITKHGYFLAVIIYISPVIYFFNGTIIRTLVLCRSLF